METTRQETLGELQDRQNFTPQWLQELLDTHGREQECTTTERRTGFGTWLTGLELN